MNGQAVLHASGVVIQQWSCSSLPAAGARRYNSALFPLLAEALQRGSAGIRWFRKCVSMRVATSRRAVQLSVNDATNQEQSE